MLDPPHATLLTIGIVVSNEWRQGRSAAPLSNPGLMEAGTTAQTDGYRSRAVARTAYRSLSRFDRVSPVTAMDAPRGDVSTSGLIA